MDVWLGGTKGSRLKNQKKGMTIKLFGVLHYHEETDV